MITIEQCRGARGLLGWTQQDLAEAAGLSKTAINNFEKGHSDIKNESLRAIRMAFEGANIEFIGDVGLKRKTEDIRILKGDTAFSELLDDIYETLRENGGEILINNIDNHALTKTPEKKILEHAERLSQNEITERVLCAQGVTTLLSPEDSCRTLPAEHMQAAMTSFIYGSKVALQLWDQEMIVVINSQEASNAERRRFEVLWNKASLTPSQNQSEQIGRA